MIFHEITAKFGFVLFWACIMGIFSFSDLRYIIRKISFY